MLKRAVIVAAVMVEYLDESREKCSCLRVLAVGRDCIDIEEDAF
jgi:hypothetical protein